jgi:hypothetical protein
MAQVTHGFFFAGVLVVVALVVSLARDPMFTGVLALAAAAGFGLAAGAWSFVVSKRKRQAEFGGREPLAAEEIFARYYEGSGLEKNVLFGSGTSVLRSSIFRLRSSDPPTVLSTSLPRAISGRP